MHCYHTTRRKTWGLKQGLTAQILQLVLCYIFGFSLAMNMLEMTVATGQTHGDEADIALYTGASEEPLGATDAFSQGVFTFADARIVLQVFKLTVLIDSSKLRANPINWLGFSDKLTKI